MAEAIGADRAYVFAYDFGRDVATNTFEWCAPGIAPHIENLQALPLESIRDAVKLHRRGEAHHIPDVSDLDDQQLRTVLQEQGIQSLLTVPLFSGGKCSGSVGFDFVRCRHLFSEEEHGLLAVFGELLTSVWERQGAAERLRVFFDSARDNIMIHEVGSDGLDEEEIRTILASLAEGESILFEATGRRKDGTTIPFELDKNIAEDRAGKIFESEYKLVRKDGRSRWGYVRETVLTRKPDGTPEQVIGAGIDITDRKAAEERIAGLLKEKELLLTEVHHRIKNNMTTMVSLLSLQASASTEPQVKQALTEAQSRMQSMTLLYEKLYRSESVSEISITEYLPSLVTDLVSTYGADRRVALEMDVAEFTLPVSLVTALGIIVNEVVTNALKYAFPDGGEGAISVKADAGPGPGGPVVTIVDDGVGLPPSVGRGSSLRSESRGDSCGI
jgi:two-component sensor histidine kinase